MRRRTFKYRIYPSKSQKRVLENTLKTCCNLYNSALEERISAWKKQKINISYYDQTHQLPEIKQFYPELNDVYSQVLCNVLNKLKKSFDNFFRRMKLKQVPGFPRFKNYKRYNSFIYPQTGFKIENNRLILSKIGSIHIKLHRLIQGKIKNCCIKRDGNQWFAIFVCELEDRQQTNNTNSVGIDVGIENFIALSNGELVSNPKWYRKTEKKLVKLQQKKKHIQKVYRKVRNQRLDFQHKLSRKLANEFGIICVEKLNINKMVNSIHSKSILDAGWNQFINLLSYKVEETGGKVVFVNPAYTSQTCPECGKIKQKTLEERQHICSCGCTMDRDVAINIFQRFLQGPYGALYKPKDLG